MGFLVGTRIRAYGSACRARIARPLLPALFRPDCHRRLRNCTESADPAGSCVRTGARGLWLLRMALQTITAGGDSHPALRTFTVGIDGLKDYAGTAPYRQEAEPFDSAIALRRPAHGSAREASGRPQDSPRLYRFARLAIRESDSVLFRIGSRSWLWTIAVPPVDLVPDPSP